VNRIGGTMKAITNIGVSVKGLVAGLSALIAVSSCTEKKTGGNGLFELKRNTGIRFTNTVQDNDTLNIINYRNFYNGGGVAVGDINNDGLADVFFTANQGANKLFLNKGNWQFEDISAKAGFIDKEQFSTGVVMADVNSDGWLDIFVCNAGNMHNPSLRSNQLFINNHDLTFTESASAFGLNDSGYTTQVSFFDYDLDGDLDCFKIDNSPVEVTRLGYPKLRDLPAGEWKVADSLKGGGDHLYRNDNGFFREVTAEAGIHGTLMSFGLGVSVGDINNDGYPDIFVSNDFFEKDYLYINQRNGTFKDEMEDCMQHNSYASMGADIGDINNDGLADIFTTDMLPADDYRLKTTLRFDNIDFYRLRSENGFYHQFLQNTLQMNNGNGEFIDIANYSGVNASEWSWGALIFDADNDGLSDIYVCNGIYRDLTNQDFLDFDADRIKQKMIESGRKNIMEMVGSIPSIAVPNKMFHNLGNLKFSDAGPDWGFDENSFSNGAAYGDLDNDGDLDLVISNVNEPAQVFQNKSRESNKNNYIGFDLRGENRNPFAIGATLKIFTKAGVQTRQVMPSRGFQSSVDYRQLVGIGSQQEVDSVIISWPGGRQTRLVRPPINQYHPVDIKKAGEESVLPAGGEPRTFFNRRPSHFEKHEDDGYTDFYNERAIPQMLSHEGPVAAVADVNGDGLEDIFIGGTVKKPGQLYLQDKEGNMHEKMEAAFQQYTGFVDGAVLFFDADGDKDMDLLLSSGGNVADPGSRELQHRLFINDGTGHFILRSEAFPLNRDNIGVVVACDFDEDGDLDLFAGARSVSGVYGLTPQSHIYINNGKGIFTDFSGDKMGGLDKAGMVTDAAWADMDADGKMELVICGEWMPPEIYKYSNGNFRKWETELKDYSGWWQTLCIADFDKDGRMDMALGNFGENFYLHPDKGHPVKMWLADFDGNGRIDKVMSRFVDGKDKPVFMKNETESELPVLKKQNLHHAVYATKSIQEIFTAGQLEKTMVNEVNYSSSCIALNRGNGRFSMRNLPVMAQLSSIKAMVVVDINGDGFPDIVEGGNEFGFQPQFGRLDANFGTLLLNSGNGDFSAVPQEFTGLNLRGQVRDIVPLKIKGKENYLFLQNNDWPVLYQKNETWDFKQIHK